MRDIKSLEFLSVVMDNPTIWKNRHKFKKSVNEAEDTGKNEQEEYDMCQAIRELIEDGKQEGIREGQLMLIIPLIHDGILSKEEAAERMGVSLEQLEDEMNYAK